MGNNIEFMTDIGIIIVYIFGSLRVMGPAERGYVASHLGCRRSFYVCACVCGLLHVGRIYKL